MEDKFDGLNVELIKPVIKFEAAVNKVQTLADNGIRVTLDLPETEIDAMTKLAICKRDGVYLVIDARPYGS